jgi:hypothetical protein
MAMNWADADRRLVDRKQAPLKRVKVARCRLADLADQARQTIDALESSPATGSLAEITAQCSQLQVSWDEAHVELENATFDLRDLMQITAQGTSSDRMRVSGRDSGKL